MSKALFEIARIKGPQGLNGKMLITPSGVLPEGLYNFKHIKIGRQGSSRNVISCRKKNKSQYVLELDGITSVDQVNLIIGESLFLRREWLPRPQDAVCYNFELIDFMVKDFAGREIGRVINIFFNGSNDVLVVDEQKEYLLPVTADLIKDVSPEQQTITIDVDLLEGLID